MDGSHIYLYKYEPNLHIYDIKMSLFTWNEICDHEKWV